MRGVAKHPSALETGRDAFAESLSRLPVQRRSITPIVVLYREEDVRIYSSGMCDTSLPKRSSVWWK